MRKEKILLRLLVVTEFIIIVISLFSLDNNVNQSYLSDNSSNLLTMMLETDIDSNEYKAATSNDWPESGYIFNAEMSGCERGGTLSWNNETNKVVMESLDPDKCYVYFDRYDSAVINNVTTSNITNSSITLTVDVTEGENSIATYYFSSDNGLSYVESNINTYTFNNLSTGMEYDFKVYVIDSNGIRSNTYSLSESTLSTVNFVDYIKNVIYTGKDGDNGLYYHDGVGTYTNATEEAGDNSYRYAGVNPNNYVCFGSDSATCPNDNLYRIIGVFGDQVKLIKSTSLGNYYWIGYFSNTTLTNIWSRSTLNTGTLNGTYINGLGTTWTDMIETTIWKVGGNTWTNLVSRTIKNVYNYEIVSPAANITFNAKIGLMYVSDYGYAASPENWTTILYNYNNDTNHNNNWMFMGFTEWTISPKSDSDYTNEVFGVDSTGFIRNVLASLDSYGVRPTFYLKSNVAITSGDGSSSNPYRLSL